jgi:hypothetical protein
MEIGAAFRVRLDRHRRNRRADISFRGQSRRTDRLVFTGRGASLSRHGYFLHRSIDFRLGWARHQSYFLDVCTNRVGFLFCFLRVVLRSSTQNCEITSRNSLRATDRPSRADLESRSTSLSCAGPHRVARSRMRNIQSKTSARLATAENIGGKKPQGYETP